MSSARHYIRLWNSILLLVLRCPPLRSKAGCHQHSNGTTHYVYDFPY